MTSTESFAAPLTRQPLRLRLADPERPQPLDGGWWPQSRHLSVEVADLVDHFPAESARIVRALYAPPDWEDSPKRVTTARGYIDTTPMTLDFSPVMILTTSDRRKLCLVVIPPELSQAEGAAALEASITPRFAASPALLLARITAPSNG